MRTYVRVGMKLLSPFRVGGWLTHDASAQRNETLRDPHDGTRPFVPASGLAGSLRAQAGLDAKALFGPSSGEELTASPWWVLGTRLSSDVTIVQRGQTPIDRVRRAAASRGYRTSDEVLPSSGYEPDIFLYLTSDEGDPQPMLDLLTRWRPTIGGGLSSGMGDAEVVSIMYRTLSFANPVELLALVDHAGVGPDRIDALLDGSETIDPRPTPAPLALQATLSLEDMLATPDDRAWLNAPWLHGSTWKGILRTRVEYIARCAGLPTCRDTDGSEAWTGCGSCPICSAFGSAESGQGCWTFACSDQVHDPDNVTTRQRTAVDRFTGGYRDHALFPESTMPTHDVILTISWGRKPEPDEEGLHGVSRALVRALGDLDDDLIGLGGRTGTGLGRVSVTELEFGTRPGGSHDTGAAGFIDGLPAGPADLSLMRTLTVTEPLP